MIGLANESSADRHGRQTDSRPIFSNFGIEKVVIDIDRSVFICEIISNSMHAVPTIFILVSLINLIVSENLRCQDLLIGQYRCDDPSIDYQTQEPVGCERRQIHSSDDDPNYVDEAPITCYTAPGIECDGGIYNETLQQHVFQKKTSCRWTNGKYYRTTLFLSLFLGKMKRSK